jgi:trans-aconitate methyltransferase
VTDLDYSRVNRYWDAVRPSVMGPYMMDGLGFPEGAGWFRLQAEAEIVDRLIQDVNIDGTVLDLGSGVGLWAEFFSKRFNHVIAVEASAALYQDLDRRCSQYENVETRHMDVSNFQPEREYSLLFFGGMLMYLNTDDVIVLLRKLVPFLESGGTVLCRETTIREGTDTRTGRYQAIYRSENEYVRIFKAAGLEVAAVELNTPYTLLEVGSQAIQTWQRLVPKPFQMTPVLGHLTYWSLRLTEPLPLKILDTMDLPYPQLRNHFFSLRAA